MIETGPVLYLIVCAAGPAGRVATLIEQAQTRGWDVWVIPTPAAVEFVDVPALEKLTGHLVRSRYRRPEEPGDLPPADAIIVAPATYNTINKWAGGIADTFALGLLAELTPIGIPITVLPFVNSAFAANPVFNRSLTELRRLGVQVLFGPGQFEPHPPGTGDGKLDTYPWNLALDTIDHARTNQP